MKTSNKAASKTNKSYSSKNSNRSSSKRGSGSRKPAPRKSNERNNYQDKFSDAEYDKGLKASTNDPAWYMSNPQLANDTANFVYGYPAGYEVTAQAANSPNYVKWSFQTGNIVSYFLIPSVGYATDPTDPINIASAELFNAVRRDQTGSPTFEEGDLMLMTLAVADIYSYINYLQRAYGMIDLLPLSNTFLPQQLFPQIDLQDAMNNRAKFRSSINLLITYAAAFCVPASMPFFRRKAFLYQNLYADGVDIKSTIYMTEPVSFYTWSQATEASAAGQLTHKVFTQVVSGSGSTKVLKKYTVDELFNFGMQLIQPLRKSDDIRYMSAAILKAFGDNALIKLSTMPEVYPITPLVDTNVLAQFKNATVVTTGNIINDAPVETTYVGLFAPVTQVTQINESYLRSTPSYQLRYYPSGTNTSTLNITNIRRSGRNNVHARIMTSPVILSADGDTSPAYNFEATRLTARIDESVSPYAIATYSAGTTSPTYQYPLICGTEICIAAYMANPGIFFSTTGLIDNLDSDVVPSYDVIRTLANNGSIDYSMAYYVLRYVNTAAEFNQASSDGEPFEADGLSVHFDFNNYAIVQRSDLKMMNRVALYSLMSIK